MTFRTYPLMCEQCGSAFEARMGAMFCSDRCRRAVAKERRRLKAEQSPDWSTTSGRPALSRPVDLGGSDTLTLAEFRKLRGPDPR